MKKAGVLNEDNTMYSHITRYKNAIKLYLGTFPDITVNCHVLHPYYIAQYNVNSLSTRSISFVPSKNKNKIME